MQNLNIKLDFEFDGSEQSVQGEIISTAARILADRYERESDGELRKLAKMKIDAAIEILIDQLFVKEIPLYSNYGESTKKSTTLKEMLFDAVKKRFDNKTDTYDNWYRQIIYDPQFKKMVDEDLKEIRAKYEINLRNIITASIEKFIKETSKGR